MAKAILILVAAGLLIGLFSSSIFGPIPQAIAFERTIRAIANEQERAVMLQELKDRIADEGTERDIRLRNLDYDLKMRAEAMRNFWTILGYGITAAIILIIAGSFTYRIVRAILAEQQQTAPPGQGTPPDGTGMSSDMPIRRVPLIQNGYEPQGQAWNRNAWEEERERRLRQEVQSNLGATESSCRREERNNSKQYVPKSDFSREPVQYPKASGSRQESIKTYRRVKG